MRRDTNRLRNFTRWCAAAAFVFFAAGCPLPERIGPEPDVWFERGVQVVEVELDDYSIHMPETLQAGETRFLVRNVGEAPHTIGLRAGGRERVLEPDLQPGEEREWTLTLERGRYEVWCPVGMHAAMGMRRELLVVE